MIITIKQFNDYWKYLMKVEGSNKLGYDSKVVGGKSMIDVNKPTKYGISIKTLNRAIKDKVIKNLNNLDSITLMKRLTEEEAEKIAVTYYAPDEKYLSHYVHWCILFECNWSGSTASKALQRALNKFNKTLLVDGILGLNTISILSSITEPCDLKYLINEFENQRIIGYKSLRNSNLYLKGWVSRAKTFTKFLLNYYDK